MAFTAYITFVAGNTLTASQLNQQLRDDGNFLLNGKAIVEKYYLKTADYTLVMPEATWTNIDSANLQVTLASTFSSGRVRVGIKLYAVVTGTSITKAMFDISIDNKTYSGSGSLNAGGVATATPMTNGLAVVSNDTGYSGSSVQQQVNIEAIITNLAINTTHTFEPMYQTVNGGSGVAKVISTYHPYEIIVEEI